MNKKKKTKLTIYALSKEDAIPKENEMGLAKKTKKNKSENLPFTQVKTEPCLKKTNRNQQETKKNKKNKRNLPFTTQVKMESYLKKTK